MRKLIITLCLVLFISFIGFNIHRSKILEFESQVTRYLTSEQGYVDGEIIEIHGSYDWMKGIGYNAKVVFKDEPKVYYLYSSNGETVYQFGYSGKGDGTYKHVETK